MTANVVKQDPNNKKVNHLGVWTILDLLLFVVCLLLFCFVLRLLLLVVGGGLLV